MLEGVSFDHKEVLITGVFASRVDPCISCRTGIFILYGSSMVTINTNQQPWGSRTTSMRSMSRHYKNHVTYSLIISVINFRLCSVKSIIGRYAIQNMCEKLLFAVAKPQSCINLHFKFKTAISAAWPVENFGSKTPFIRQLLL